jgi:D-xylose transport system permease protein
VITSVERDPRLAADEGVRGQLGAFRRRVTGGELGALPVVIGLVAICVFLQAQNNRFLTPANVTNLFLQVAAVGTISVGVVLVLLLGEIDLSVAAVSGVTSAVMAVLAVKHGVPPVVAVLAALVLGAAIGAFQGFMFAVTSVPSFVVTLAGLIAWQGVLLQVLGSTGTVNLPFGTGVSRLVYTFFGDLVGYLLAAAVVAAFVLLALGSRRQRRAAGLEASSPLAIGVRATLLAVGVFFLVYWLNRDRGVPLALVIFVGFVVVFDLLTRHTAYGRHIFAVGGNPEAARRAGINVTAIRISVFVLAATMAAAGGVLAAARLTAVNQSTGGGDLLLNAIAAAVIGGTSLFGGRGSPYSALLGVLVIGSISNGLDLLNQSSAVKFMITGAVLLVAATIDALARRGRQARGRA